MSLFEALGYKLARLVPLDRAVPFVCAFTHYLSTSLLCSSMSQEIDLEGKSQYSHTIDRSTLRDSSASYPQKEKVDIYYELEAPLPGPISPSETVSRYHLHAQDDIPDGGLRAWLVVLGVRSLLFAISQWAADELYFSVHVQSSQRERLVLHAVALLQSWNHRFFMLIMLYRFGYVNSFGVSEPPNLTRLQVFIVILDGSLFKVFQEYYESILLKGTSPSTMYVISVLSESCFLFFGHLILPASSAWIGSTQVRVLIECSSAEAN